MMKQCALIVLLLTGTFGALAHSWYPPECCNEGDCRSIPCGQLSEETKLSGHGGKYDVVVYTEAGKQFYADFKNVRPSPDAQCHACFQPGTLNMRCIFRPQGTS